MKGRRCKKSKNEVTERDTAISLFKEGGESPPRRMVPLCSIRASLLMSKSASSVLFFPSSIATLVVQHRDT